MNANFNEDSFWNIVRQYGKKIGYDAVYGALQLFYVIALQDTPAWVKSLAIGALAYLVMPIDAIPDFLPGGYVDDAALIASVLGTIAAYISNDVRNSANASTPNFLK